MRRVLMRRCWSPDQQLFFISQEPGNDKNTKGKDFHLSLPLREVDFFRTIS